jgi:REP element-mobilizing transposase RayT
MARTFTRLLVHVIFSTKERRPVIDSELKPRLLAYMGGIIAELGGKEIAGNAVTDHEHLLLSLPATKSLAEILRVVKTNSSRWVHETWPARSDFAWQTGYGAFGVSQSNVERVRRYIANQEEHHRTVTFQDEFLSFLHKHGIEYDPRFVWD